MTARTETASSHVLHLSGLSEYMHLRALRSPAGGSSSGGGGPLLRHFHPESARLSARSADADSTAGDSVMQSMRSVLSSMRNDAADAASSSAAPSARSGASWSLGSAAESALLPAARLQRASKSAGKPVASSSHFSLSLSPRSRSQRKIATRVFPSVRGTLGGRAAALEAFNRGSYFRGAQAVLSNIEAFVEHLNSSAEHAPAVPVARPLSSILADLAALACPAAPPPSPV